MLPDLTLLLALLLGLQTFPETEVAPWFAILGTAACVAVAAAMIRLAGQRGAAAAEAGDEATAWASERWTGAWALLGWLGCLQGFEWGAFVQGLVPRVLWMVPYAVLFLPAAVLFATAWAARSRVEVAVRVSRGAHVAPPTAREAVLRHGKRNGIALLPFFVVVGALEAFYVLGELGVPGVKRAYRWVETLPLLGLLVMMGLMTTLSVALPWIVRRMLRTKPLPAGPLRSALERAATAMRLRYGHLVVWRTGGRVLNAMVVGLTPGTRTIFLTDGLIDKLPEEEVVAVFAHEAGHAKKHHLAFFLVLFFSLALLFEALVDDLAELGVPPLLLAVGQLAILWFGMLGWVSRRFEREADVHGAERATDGTGDPGPVPVPGLPAPLPFGASLMIRALERVGRLTGHTRSHRHGSIEERIRFIATYATTPEVRQRYRAARGRLLVGIAAFAVVSVTLAALQAPGDVRYARAVMRTEDGAEAYATAVSLDSEGQPAAGRIVWLEAKASFDAAARQLAGATRPRALYLDLLARFNAADVVLHGLRDRAAAAPLLEDVLARADASGLPREAVGGLRFQAQVDLGRIEAGRGLVDAATKRLGAARTALPAERGQKGAWYRARLALLEDVVDATRGLPGARDRLAKTASKAREKGAEWEELRRDAEEDLALLDARR